jgi:hypothetical protein
MVAKHKFSHRFAGVARIMMSLVVFMGLALVVFPKASLAAPTTGQAVGFLTVHVTNYQHHTNLEGALVTAVGTNDLVIYRARTNHDGFAKLQVTPSIYNISVSIAAVYAPWSGVARVDTSSEVSVDARVIYIPETYSMKLGAVDAKTRTGVPGASVSIYDTRGQILAQGTTSNNGSFAARVPAGVFNAAVQHPKFETHKDFVRIVTDQPNSTVVALAPKYEPSLGDMQIHALDAYTSLPVEGASVTLYNNSGAVLDQGITDAKGTYYTCLPEGKYTVVLTAPRYVTNTNTYTIARGTLTHYKVLLVSPMAK